LKTRLYNY